MLTRDIISSVTIILRAHFVVWIRHALCILLIACGSSVRIVFRIVSTVIVADVSLVTRDSWEARIYDRLFLTIVLTIGVGWQMVNEASFVGCRWVFVVVVLSVCGLFLMRRGGSRWLS